MSAPARFNHAAQRAAWDRLWKILLAPPETTQSKADPTGPEFGRPVQSESADTR